MLLRLLQKTDAASQATVYTYFDAADYRLATRGWARAITTSYTYDPKTGELLTTDYSDTGGTDVTFSYDRAGRREEAGSHLAI